MTPLWIGVLAFIGVATLVGGIAMLVREKPVSKIESRLDLLTGSNSPSARDALAAKEGSILQEPLDDRPNIFHLFFERFGNVKLLLEQADVNLSISKLAGISLVLSILAMAGGVIVHLNLVIVFGSGIFMAMLPLMWIMFRRKRRLNTFASQLPDALEMLSRGLRSGQSMIFGFNMVASEMPAPISKEFGRVFEEQNLGIPLEESLRGMTARIPNLDLKFFVTAVVLQRQTGGDLAEILDKIGYLIRERFKIWGQVQALTGEGRLSGIVLLALPFALFLAVYQLNPTYIMMLFTDPLGTKMLTVALIMQVVGALVIRKIVTIKV
jgi:tight adherence protein B